MNAYETTLRLEPRRDLRRLAHRAGAARARRAGRGDHGRAAAAPAHLRRDRGLGSTARRRRRPLHPPGARERRDHARGDRRQPAPLPRARRARRPRGLDRPHLPAAHLDPREHRRRRADAPAPRGGRLAARPRRAARARRRRGKAHRHSATPTTRPARSWTARRSTRSPRSPAGCGAYVLGDEVYRGIDQDGDGTTAAIADLYESGISIGSMSKAYSLAGLRLGWIAGPADVLHRVSIHRDYNTISVGMLDDRFASLALEHHDTSCGATARSRARTSPSWTPGSRASRGSTRSSRGAAPPRC